MSIVNGPVLYLDPIAVPLWWDEQDNRACWMCDKGVRLLFQLGDSRRVRLFSSSSSRPDTYEVVFDDSVLVVGDREFPIMYDSLTLWLKIQIDNKRPHIGIEILSGQ